MHMLKERPLTFPQDKTLRVILDTDCYNECDDQFCVAHALMTPRFDIKAIIAEQYGGVMPNLDSEQKSYDEICNIVRLMGLEGEVNILHGCKTLLPDTSTPVESEGSRFIIEEALRDDPRPLFVCTQGAVTNLASALLMKPEIAERITVISILGSPYPQGGFEFNQNNDINAARVLYQSKAEMWQVPSNVYTTMKISYFEMMNSIYPCGEIGKYLVEYALKFGKQMMSHMKEMEEMMADSPMAKMNAGQSRAAAMTSFGGELWSLGDSPCVGLMMNSTMGRFHYENAPTGLSDTGEYLFEGESSRQIRVYDDIDSHFILNDMIAKLKFYFG